MPKLIQDGKPICEITIIREETGRSQFASIGGLGSYYEEEIEVGREPGIIHFSVPRGTRIKLLSSHEIEKDNGERKSIAVTNNNLSEGIVTAKTF